MNPLLGVFFHWLGGFASGSFYVPYRRVRLWSWETYWLVGGFFSWILMPILLASLMTRDLLAVLQAQSFPTLFWTYLFGVLWGVGGLTFGLTMRYLGLSLGMGVALGYCAAFGTLLPPIMKMFLPEVPVDENIAQIAATLSGQITLGGVAVCLLGIAVAALAGLVKEREMSAADKQKSIAEFNFPKGIALATFSGIMSACFAFALAAARPRDLEAAIRSTGFYRAKAKNILGCCRALVARHEGRVPTVLADLVRLPGVGRKTANVVLGSGFGLAEGIVVDTHVGRIARRLGLTRHADAVKAERDLVKMVPRDHWISFSHRLIEHGRTICSARTPRCDDCPLADLCPRVGVGPGRKPARRPNRARKSAGRRPQPGGKHNRR
ncbi:hypothetical protein EBR56_04280 [bacterium]|nr:hypothetical protein [bacterium]